MALQESIKRLIYLLGGLFIAYILVAIVRGIDVVQSTEVLSGSQTTLYLPQMLTWIFDGLGFTVLVMLFTPLSAIVLEYAGKLSWARNNQEELMQTYLGLYLVMFFAIALSWARSNLGVLMDAIGSDNDLVGIFSLLFGAAITLSGIYAVYHGAKIWAVASEQLAGKLTNSISRSPARPGQQVGPTNNLTCTKCNTPLTPELSFCPRCGTPAAAPLREVSAPALCPLCHATLPPNVSFCPKCGGKVAAGVHYEELI